MRWPWEVDAPSSPLSGARSDSLGLPIAWLAGGLIVVSAGALALALFYLHGETLRSGERLTQSLVQVIEEQTSRTFQTVDQRLQLAADGLQALQAEKRLDEDSARTLLREQLEALPYVRAMWVLDAQGRIVFDSDTGNIGVSLEDREYFQVYRQRPATGFHISAPVRSRSTGTWLISASRPLQAANRVFSGVIVAAVEPKYFDKLWSGVDLGSGGTIALLRRDGVLMMRSPMDDTAMGNSFRDLRMFSEMAKSEQGSYEAISKIDGHKRILSYRVLGAYPELLATVGSSYNDVLTPWKRYARLTALIWLVAVAIAAMLATFLYRYAQQRERTELRFRELAQAMPQIVFVTDANGFMSFINKQWTRVTGLPVEASQGGGWFTRVHPADLEKTAEDFRFAIESGQPMRNEHRLLCGDGTYRWQLARVIPHRDHRGRIESWYGTSTDIDDLKQAETAMATQAKLLSMAGQLSRMGGWALELPDMRVIWSKEASIVLELPDGIAPTLETAINLCTPQSQALAAQVVRACLENGTPFDVEVEMVTGTGRHIWVRSLGTAARDAKGNILGMQGALQDVTARVQAEREVQAHLETLQRTAEAAQAITQHRDLETMMQEVADQARAIVGAHQATMSLTHNGDSAQSIHALSLSDKYAAYRQLTELPDGSGLHTLVCETNRPLRLTHDELLVHPRWSEPATYANELPPMRGWLAVPLTGRDGASMGILQLSGKFEGEFTQQDEYVATELAELAQIAIDNVKLLAQVRELNSNLEEKIAVRTRELSRQEALFRALAEQAPQPIWTIDSGGNGTFVSRAWCQLFGGEPSDWEGPKWMTLVHPEDMADLREIWKAHTATRSAYTGTRRMRARDGSYRTMAYSVSPVIANDGAVLFWVGIDVDMTEIKAIETALRTSNAELEAFSYSVSHDLRSPLNTVDGFSRLLAKEISVPQGGKAHHYLTRIQAGAAQMGQLIEGLLSLAHVMRLELRRETVNLSTMSEEILESLRLHEPERQVDSSIEPGLCVLGDSRLLRSVMENLLGNAWKFSAQRIPAIIAVGWSPEHSALFVRDNGAGFDMAYANKLFGTFQRLHAVEEFSGTGIGLATVARVIRRHGGTIWAEASPNQGATFYFTLTAAP